MEEPLADEPCCGAEPEDDFLGILQELKFPPSFGLCGSDMTIMKESFERKTSSSNEYQAVPSGIPRDSEWKRRL